MFLSSKTKEELISEITHLRNELNTLRSKAYAPAQPKGLVDFSHNTPDNTSSSKDTFKYLVEAINEVIYKIDAQGYIQYISPNVEKIFGVKSSEMIGHHMLEFLGKDNAEAITEKYNKIALTGISLSEYLVPVKDNKQVWLRLSTRAIFENGVFIGSYGTLIDISDKKSIEIALQISEANARIILESSPDYIFLISTEGIVIDSNERNAYQFGISKQELIGKDIFTFYSPETARRRQKYLLEAIEKKTLVRKEDFKEGCWFESSFLPILHNENEVEKIVVYSKDITERKNSELILKQRDIKLRELVATKDKFFSIMSHDLRSPFNAILGFSELLNENVTQKNYDDLEMYAGIINKSAKHAYDLLQNLLNWSRTQLGTIPYNPIDINLCELINYAIEFTTEHRIQKQHSIVFNPQNTDIIINADKELMIAIIINLLSNANKYTKSGGIITIDISTENSKAHVSFSDNGIGISKSNLNKLFKIEYSFSTPGTNKEVGTGLGLILCKEFIEKQHGKIWVESSENQGSKFSFSIPISH